MKPAEVKYVESDKGKIALVTLTNNKGAKVVLSSLGAGIVEVWVPDKRAKWPTLYSAMPIHSTTSPTDLAQAKCPVAMPTASPKGISPSTA